MKSSITTRWVRGSLFFTLALVLVAEGVFLYFTITGYYNSVRQAMRLQYETQRAFLVSPVPATVDDRLKRMIQMVEQFEAKTQFELMLVNENGTIHATSSGMALSYAKTPQDIVQALSPGGPGNSVWTGRSESGEKEMAMTVRTAYSARGVVAVRFVTSLTLVDRNIRNTVVASAALFLTIILASVVSGVYFIRSIVRPLQKVEATASRIAEGDFDTRIDNHSSDEIGSLCKTINYMAEELGRTERLKNEFISSVSHELRTPLTSIKGWTETVSRLDDPGNPNFRRGMEIIASEADRLYDMVEELLDFSRMQDGLALTLELLDLAAEVEEAVLLSCQRAAALGVALLYEAPELPVPVMADKNRVRQVLVNVIDNAVKYSYTGGQIDLSVGAGEDEALVVVADEGQGILPGDLENVKTKFYKGKGAVRGSGIGLAVVDEIMAAHSGRLSLESEPDRGTRVSLRFPLYRMGPKKEGPASNAESGEARDGETGKKNEG